MLPADGLVSYFAFEPQSLQDQQDQAMALLAFFGCLRGCELANIELGHLEEVNDGIMVSIIRFKTTNKPMRFLLPNSVPKLDLSPSGTVLKYLNLVKPWLESRKLTRLWPRPSGNNFSAQFRGKNHIGQVAKKIAAFLKIDPAKFTGHSFRRSAATAAADAGISLINLKRFGGWKSDSVASSYVDDSLAITKTTADMLLPHTAIAETARPITPQLPNEQVQLVKSIQAIVNDSTGVAADVSSLVATNKSANVVFNFYVNNH